MTTHTDLIARLRDDEANCHENAGEAADALESLEQQVAALEADKEQQRRRYDDVAVLAAALRTELTAQQLQVAALTRAVDTDYEQLYREANDQIAAAQAREAKLRDAAKAVLEVGMGSDFEALNAALALPTDDSALMERLKEEYKRGYKAGITTGSMT